MINYSRSIARAEITYGGKVQGQPVFRSEAPILSLIPGWAATGRLVRYMGREMVLCWVNFCRNGKWGFSGFHGSPGPSVYLLWGTRERHPKIRSEGVGSRVENQASDSESGQRWGWVRWQDEGSEGGHGDNIVITPAESISRQE